MVILFIVISLLSTPAIFAANGSTSFNGSTRILASDSQTTFLQEGKIRSLDEKGFGFIAGQNSDIFFHLSALEDITFGKLTVGQSVKYLLENGPKGPRAVVVKTVEN